MTAHDPACICTDCMPAKVCDWCTLELGRLPAVKVGERWMHEPCREASTALVDAHFQVRREMFEMANRMAAISGARWVTQDDDESVDVEARERLAIEGSMSGVIVEVRGARGFERRSVAPPTWLPFEPVEVFDCRGGLVTTGMLMGHEVLADGSEEWTVYTNCHAVDYQSRLGVVVRRPNGERIGGGE